MREHSFIQLLSVFLNSCELEESKLFEIKGEMKNKIQEIKQDKHSFI